MIVYTLAMLAFTWHLAVRTSPPTESSAEHHRATSSGSDPAPGTTTAASAGRTRHPLTAPACVTLLVIVIAAAGLVVNRHISKSPAGSAATVLGSPTDTTSYPTAPAPAVQGVHTALHDMAERCTPGAGIAAEAQIGHDVDQLITFAKTYPDARFTVNDENGRALDLLFIARNEMRACAPNAAERANQALPTQYRAIPGPPTTSAAGASTGK